MKVGLVMKKNINNTIVDGIASTSVQNQMEKKNPTIKGFTGYSSIDAILSYGYKEMSMTGRNWFIYDLPVSLIKIDNSYQRVVNDSIVRSIIRNYDNNRVDVKLVNFRFNPDGTGNFWILDGQHTLTVEKELGHETLTCKVFIGLSQKEEAKLFSKQNEFRRSITAFAQFKAEVVAEMKPAVDIKNLCDKYHIEIKQARGMVPANTITSVRKLYNIVNKFGIEGLDFTLQTIIELGWNKVEAGMNEKVLSIYVAYPYCKGNATNYSKLKATLGSFESPQKMIDFSTDKYRDEAKVQTKCVEMFVENIF